MNNGWFSLDWGPGCPADAPRALLSLAALGDMLVKPEPPERVRAEIAKVFPKKRFAWLIQEHSRVVLQADAASGRPGDGLVTNNPETLLGVTVADCMPIFIWDTTGGARALCHSGWKGTGIVREAVRLMQAEYGAESGKIRAILGPSIRACCYAIPKERAEAFSAEFGSEAAFFRDGEWYIDLAAANKNILHDEGIEDIHTHCECTCCDTRFSSYRRQGKDFTHMLALCGM